MHSSFMEFDFGKIHYQHLVSDKEKTILFLHSFNSSAQSFTQVCDLLKDHANIYCLDLPGHGLSAHVDINKHSEYYSISGFTKVLIEFLKRMPLKNVFIVGNSAGGNAAVRAMAFYKIQGLVLMGSIQAKTAEQAFDIMFPHAPTTLLFKNKLNQQEVEELTAAYVSASNGTEGFRQMAYDINQTDGNCREIFGQSIEREEWPNELQLIKNSTIPLLYILGLQDGFINSIQYEKILITNDIKKSQIKLLEQVGHCPHLDNPELCAKLILEFIDKNS